MAKNKNKPTDASVEDYIASRANEQQRTDCQELMAAQEDHPATTKDVGAKHRWVWLLPVHLREPNKRLQLAAR